MTPARVATREPSELASGPATHERSGIGRRRFTIAALVGTAVAFVPYAWVLTTEWNGRPSLFRTAYPDGWQSNFYDIQARAILHGHLSLPKGAIGLEAFVHDGRQFTYFGVFPALIRIPFLLFTHSLDGRLTAPSMLAAWMVTALFSSLLVWRVRGLLVGDSALSMGEAVSLGVFQATILAGTVLIFLASNPFVFSEDLAWSVALTIGALFALIGVLERPGWSRIVFAFALVLGANLNRAPTGYACVIGAVLGAGWLAMGRAGEENRRWWSAVLAVGLIPLAIACAINWVKFGVLFGLPTADQLIVKYGFTRSGNQFTPSFLFSTVWAYFWPGALRFQAGFPFVTLPTLAPTGIGATLFHSEPTASLPASTPLLFLSACWGVVAAFVARPFGRRGPIRVALLAAASATSAVLIFGWIVDRFLGDFLPVLVLAGAVGLIDVWRRLRGRRRSARIWTVAATGVVGLFSVVANVGIASTPFFTWSNSQIARYVDFEGFVSDVSGHLLAPTVQRVSELPTWAPAGQLYTVGDCTGLYMSHGWGYPWWIVEESSGVSHTVVITFRATGADLPASVPLVEIGRTNPSTVYLRSAGSGKVRLSLRSPHYQAMGATMHVRAGRTYRITLEADAVLRSVSVSSQGQELLEGSLTNAGTGAVHIEPHPPLPQFTISVAEVGSSKSDMSLCHRLVSQS